MTSRCFSLQIIGSSTFLTNILPIKLTGHIHTIHQFGPFHRIIQQLIQRRFCLFIYSCQHFLCFFTDPPVLSQTPPGFIVIYKRKLGIGTFFTSTPIVIPVSPPHVFRFSGKSQIYMWAGNVFQCIVILFSEDFCQPTGRISMHIIFVELVDIISHIEKKRYLCLSPFQVSTVCQPDTVGRSIIRFAKLFIH